LYILRVSFTNYTTLKRRKSDDPGQNSFRDLQNYTTLKLAA